MVAVCDAAIFVDGHMVLETSVALTGDFVSVGAASNSQSVPMAFSSFVASVTECLVMASCNCLMAEMRQLVAYTAGSGM